MSGSDIKYLIPAEGDQLWGLTVTSVGSQVITAEEEYPPQNHPKGYFLMWRLGVFWMNSVTLYHRWRG